MIRFAACSVLLVSVLLTPSVRAEDEGTALRFELKDDQTGSHLPRQVARAKVPLNRSYADLTDEQRRRVLVDFPQLAAGDEPPFPQGGLGALVEPIYRAQKKIQDSGMLKLNLLIDAEGSLQRVSVLDSPSAQTTRAASAIALAVKWKPARCGDKPCAMDFPLRIKLERKL